MTIQSDSGGRVNIGGISAYVPVIMLVLQAATVAVYFGEYSNRFAAMELHTQELARAVRDLRDITQEQATRMAVQTEQLATQRERIANLESSRARR